MSIIKLCNYADDAQFEYLLDSPFVTEVTSGNYNAQMFNSFLDGTKSAIEMGAVANASKLVPQKCGLQFPPVGVDDLPGILKPNSAVCEIALPRSVPKNSKVRAILYLFKFGKPKPIPERWEIQTFASV